MMVSCQSSFLCRLQLVSRHVIEVQEIGFKSLVRSSGEVGLQQILAGNVITCLEPLIDSAVSSSGVVVTLEIFFLGLGITVTEVNIKKV